MMVIFTIITASSSAQVYFSLNSSGISNLLWPFGNQCSYTSPSETFNGSSKSWVVKSGSDFHKNADLYADDWNWGGGNDDEGQELYACGAGKVIYINKTAGTVASCDNPNFGRQVIIRFNNSDFAVRYAHMKDIAPGLSVGSLVTAGQFIGNLGKTGLTGTGLCTAHLHIVLYKNISDGSANLTNLQSGGSPSSSCAAKFYVNATKESGSSGTPATSYSPTGYVSCPTTSASGSGCSSASPNLVKMKVNSLSSGNASFQVIKCDGGKFTESGTFYIKEGDICGTIVTQVNYSSGVSNSTTSSKPVQKGKTYYGMVISQGGVRYYAGKITFN